MQDPKVLVPSPTYLLSQTYELPHEELSLHHMDLYRLPEFTPIEEQALGLSRACHDGTYTLLSERDRSFL